ncbi:MAG: diaminopimelate decarboxylase [Thalassobaculaceae bacterium]|nr:diaminopimelate decarboxylase [Thalassobaculaceae bacterium]
METDPRDGALITALAAKVGTPFWLYDAGRIERQIERLRGFDTIRYAQKANSNLDLLRIMRRNGVKIDAVSNGEITRALTAGYAAGGDDLVFTADIFDRATLERVAALGIPVNCGSPDMIDQIASISPGHRIWLRINPGFGHGHSNKTNTGGPFSKHGIWHEQLPELGPRIEAAGLDLVGLHMHIGSGVDYEHLERVGDAMIDAYRALGLPVRAVSAGGGLSVPYRDGGSEIDTAHYIEKWNSARLAIQQHQSAPVEMEIEPGRFLVAAAGCLVAEVRAVKRVAERFFVVVDAGFNDLARPAMYGSYHRIGFVDAQGAQVGGALHPVAVAGPLCESGDVFTQGEGGVVEFRDMPLPKVGDFCVFADAGAYGAAMSSNYNSRPLIPEVVIDGDRLRLARRRQTMDELLALETGEDLMLDSVAAERERRA